LVELIKILVALHQKLTDDLIRSTHISLQCLMFPGVTSVGRANGQTGGSYPQPRECVVASELLQDLDLRGTSLRERQSCASARAARAPGAGTGPADAGALRSVRRRSARARPARLDVP